MGGRWSSVVGFRRSRRDGVKGLVVIGWVTFRFRGWRWEVGGGGDFGWVPEILRNQERLSLKRAGHGLNPNDYNQNG